MRVMSLSLARSPGQRLRHPSPFFDQRAGCLTSLNERGIAASKTALLVGVYLSADDPRSQKGTKRLASTFPCILDKRTHFVVVR
jgi:hypothetical protein